MTAQPPTISIFGTGADDILLEPYAPVDIESGNIASHVYLFGMGGNDTLVADVGYFGPDLCHSDFHGGSGNDVVSYKGSFVGVELNLADGEASRTQTNDQGTFVTKDDLISIENVWGSDHADYIVGDGGANVLKGNDGSDTIKGGGGADTVDGGDDGDLLYGEDGADSIEGGDGGDLIYGGAQSDTLIGEGGNDTMAGGGGGDFMYGGAGTNVLYGEGGNDVILIEGKGQAQGGSGSDTIVGGQQGDTLDGGANGDLLNGLGGNDIIDGGMGDDDMSGGNGVDTLLFTTNGDVTVWMLGGGDGFTSGADGDDTFEGFENVTVGNGDDFVMGDTGSNAILAGGGTDAVYANAGNDVVDGGAGDDSLYGNEGNDTMIGGNDEDKLWGQEGEDVVTGGAGKDTLRGGEDDDVLYGNSGNDLLVGGEGNDTINGGTGADVIRWEVGDSGTDLIEGYFVGVDKLYFESGFLAFDIGNVPLAGLLQTFAFTPTTTGLMANTAANGWEMIAVMQGVNAAQVQGAINDGSIIADPVVNPDFEPGGGYAFGGLAGDAGRDFDSLLLESADMSGAREMATIDSDEFFF